jgi:hypothetical protein
LALSAIELEIPEKTKRDLESGYNQVLARNIILQQVFVEFVSMLNDEQIPVVPLKGIYLSEVVYKDIGVRHLSDIDVLIKNNDLEYICELMKKHGWSVTSAMVHSNLEAQEFTHAHPATLVKGQMRIELHTHLYNGNQGADISESDLWADTNLEQFLGVEIRQLSNELLLQHLCLHLHKHLFGQELKILGFCDIREFLAMSKDRFSWKQFEDIAVNYKCKEEIDQILYLCVKYWNISVPKKFFNSEIPQAKLEERFWSFTGGISKKENHFLDKINGTTDKVSQLKTKRDRLTYLFGFVFPSPAFMRNRYQLDQERWLLLWYLYRPLDLAIKTIRAFFG